MPAWEFCADCRGSLAPIRPPRCESCSHPFSGMADHFQCPNCNDRGFHFDCAVAAYPSRGVVREMIHRFKYNGAVWLAPHLGLLLSIGLSDPRLAGRKFTALVPVPLHALRQRDRGFNQSELLAGELSRLTRIPVRLLLERRRATTTQTHFDRVRRIKNLRDAFNACARASAADGRFLLIDDVLTTGSTLDECARVLLDAGASQVSALTLARG